MNWRVHVHDGVARQLEAIPPDRRARILSDIAELAADPLCGWVKPLQGKHHKGHYRRVSGRYRIIFKPVHADRVVEVLAVLLRNERTYK
jgi:mRNA-degrading endonuclease RelE of RelBE toxin-antitoxin system